MEDNHHHFIEKLKNGEEIAYAHLLKIYYKRLYAYVITLGHDHAIAEDIIQNVFLKLWEYRAKLDPNYSLQSFLYKSCYNEFINFSKKNRKLTYFDKVYLETAESSIDLNATVNLEAQKELIFKGVSLLPEKCAEIFMLSKKEGLTNSEIAEYLNISCKTVEGHLTKAFTILREKLGAKMVSILFILVNKFC